MGFVNNTGIQDSKKTRQLIVEKANLLLNALLQTLGSNYVQSNAFPMYAVQLKSMAYEAARIIVNAEGVYNDLIFQTTRPEFLYQNLETYLFFNQTYSFAAFDDQSARNFLLALIKAYFAGATKASMTAALELGISGQATITLDELFLQGRGHPEIDFVPLQHNFLVSIFVTNENVDIIALQANINFLASQIKPAHTAVNTRFIFSEPAGGGEAYGGQCVIVLGPDGKPIVGPDGFEVTQKLGPTGLCDAFNMKIFEYGYEDIRKDIYQPLEVNVVGEAAYLTSPTTLQTRYGPISDGSGNLITNVNQVSVFVNGVQVPVLSVDGLKGIITLVNPVPAGAVVTVTYTFLKRHFEFLTTNNIYTVLNQFDSFEESIDGKRYSSVIWSDPLLPDNKTPLACDYKYLGFDGVNSSLLNDPSTLVFNKVDTRDKLNDYWVFESYNYNDAPAVTLNYGVPLFVLRQEKLLVPELSDHKVFKLNDALSLMNSLIYTIVGSTTAWQSRDDQIQRIYADLEVTETCNGGVVDRLKPIAETGFDLIFNYAATNGEVYTGFNSVEANNILTLNNTNALTNEAQIYIPRDFGEVGFTRLDLDDRVSETMPTLSEVLSGFSQQIVWPLQDYKSAVDQYFLLNDPNYITNDPLDLLPPLPQWEIGEELELFNVALLENDNFFIPKFMLNDPKCHLNNPDDPYGILRRAPGDANHFISEYLLEFTITGTSEYDFQDQYMGAHDIPHYDITNFLIEDPVTGYQDVYFFNLGWSDSYPTSAVVDNASFQISNRVGDAFSAGQVILFPYFFANFAPIAELIQSFSFVMSGSGYSEQFTAMQDDYMNNFHPVYEEDVRGMGEELKLMMVDEEALFASHGHTLNPVGDLSAKFEAAEPAKPDFKAILDSLSEDKDSSLSGWKTNPSGSPRGGNFATV